MKTKILIILLLLFAISNAGIAVVHQQNTILPPFTEGMVARINNFSESRRFAVSDKDGLLQIAQNSGVKMIVILSTAVAEDYVRLIREGETLAPQITIPDIPLREEDALILAENGIVCIPTISPVPLVRGLSGRFNINPLNVGYLYGADGKNVALSEISQLKSQKISVLRRHLKTPVSPDEFANAVERFHTRNVSVYRFCGQNSILSFFEQEPSKIPFLERRATAIIVDNPKFLNLFSMPVAIITRNNAILERIIPIIVFAALRDQEAGIKSRFEHPIRIHATSVMLYSNGGRGRGEKLIESGDLLVPEIDKINQQLRHSLKSKSGDDLWETYISTLGTILDTSAFTGKNAMLIPKSIIDDIDYAALILVIAIIVILAVCIMLIKTYQRKSYKRRIALIMPGAVNKIVLTDNDGKSIPLKGIIENEGFQMKLTSSLGGARRVVRKNYPNIVFADWTASGEILRNLFRAFTASHKYSQMGIVVINIPVGKQAEMKKRFAGASIYCYEKLPTLDDVLSHLRGEKGFSAYSEGSYISGIIRDDNLSVVLQMIEGNAYTGRLIVEESKPVSLIYFRDGRIVHAVNKSGGQSGVNAIYAALNCHRGNYYFHLNKPAPSETLNLGAIEVLMGWADQKDRIAGGVKAVEE